MILKCDCGFPIGYLIYSSRDSTEVGWWAFDDKYRITEGKE